MSLKVFVVIGPPRTRACPIADSNSEFTNLNERHFRTQDIQVNLAWPRLGRCPAEFSLLVFDPRATQRPIPFAPPVAFPALRFQVIQDPPFFEFCEIFR